MYNKASVIFQYKFLSFKIAFALVEWCCRHRLEKCTFISHIVIGCLGRSCFKSQIRYSDSFKFKVFSKRISLNDHYCNFNQNENSCGCALFLQSTSYLLEIALTPIKTFSAKDVDFVSVDSESWSNTEYSVVDLDTRYSVNNCDSIATHFSVKMIHRSNQTAKNPSICHSCLYSQRYGSFKGQLRSCNIAGLVESKPLNPV